MRKFLISILIIIACCCATLGVACANKTSKHIASIEIGYESVDLTLGESKWFTPKYEYKEGSALSFSSSNSFVATVDNNGLVKALNVGQTVITVKYGKLIDKCTVNVGLGNQLPMLKVPAVKNDTVKIARNTFVDLATIVVFNGKNYKDAKVTYTVQNDNVGRIDDGVFTPLNIGETEVYVKATWQGVSDETLNKTITIKVVSDVEISINDGLDKELVLYSLDDTVLPFSVTCKEDGEEGEATVTLTKGAEYIDYDVDAKTITSKGLAGYGELTVNFVATSGNEYQKIIPVYVKHTVKEHLETLVDFSALDGDFVSGDSIREIFGEDIVSATCNSEIGLRVEDNRIFDLPTSGTEMTQTELMVYGATYALKINLNAYTKVIDEVEDLKMFIDGWETFEKGPAHSGYYILNKNIDASEYVHSFSGDSYMGGNANQYDTMDVGGLLGTFDGNGYTIDGITMGAHGFFVHVKGTVKNVAFTNVKFVSGYSYMTTIAAYLMGATISNVYIQTYNYGTGGQGSSIAWHNAYDSNVENLLVEFPVEWKGSTNQKKAGYGVFKMWNEHSTSGWLPTFWRNAYVISPTVLNWRENTKLLVDAPNKAGEITPPEGSIIKYQSGILRYATEAEMRNANLNFSSMPSEYWTEDNGLLRWKGRADAKTDVSLLDAVIEEFSAYDGDININKAFGEDMSKTIEVISAYQGKTKLEYTHGKLLGVTPKFIKENGKITDVDYAVVTLTGRVNGVEKTVNTGIKAYTRLIDQPSDMLMFQDTADKFANGTPFNGYYKLVKNLVMTENDTNIRYNGNSDLNSRMYAKEMLAYNYGLTGVFDGNGYTIDGMTPQRWGLFGVVNGGTVKNVAFTNVATTDRTQWTYVIAGHLTRATIENVYIQTKKMSSYTSVGRSLAWLDAYNSTIKNVVIEQPVDISNSNNGYGSLSAWNYETYQNVHYAERSRYENVYVISPVPLTVKYSNGDKYALDGENTTATSMVVGKETIDGVETDVVSDITKLVGVKRYATKADLVSANLEFTGMDATFWNISSGSVSFKSKDDPKLDISELNATVDNFSALDGDIDLYEVFSVDRSSEIQIISATQNGNELDIEDGKILGVTPVINYANGVTSGVDYATIILIAEIDDVEVFARVGLKAYTKILTKAEDLELLISNVEPNGDSSVYAGKSVDGYYVLGNDIDASDYVHPAAAGYLTGANISSFASKLTKGHGFIGTFDGMGHTISNLTTTGQGVFGVINGGTVRNVSFNNVTRVTEYEQNTIIACFVINANIENVYASANNGVQNGAIFSDILNSTVKNCVFEVTGSTSSGKASWGSLTRTATDKFESSTFTDVYVISSYVLTHFNANSDYEVDASNRLDAFIVGDNSSNSWANAKQYTLNGVKRYDTRALLISAKENFNTWDSKYWDIASGAPVFKYSGQTFATNTKIDMFSVYDGDIDLKTAFGASANDTVTLTSATQNGKVLAIDGAKIKGVTPKFTYLGNKIVDVEYVLVTLKGTVNGEERSVDVALKAYTRVIDQTADLDAIVGTGDGVTNFAKIDGYYILSNNLSEARTHSAYNGALSSNGVSGYYNGTYLDKYGFTGVFDGNGFTISNLTVGYNGIFGWINGGTVKNVRFDNVSVSTGGADRGILATYMFNATIENVYFDVVKLNSGAGRTGLFVGSLGSNLKDVLIRIQNKYSGTSTSGYGSLLASDNATWWGEKAANVYENVHVISTIPLAVSATKYTSFTDGANRANDATKPTGLESYTQYTLTGVNRYDTPSAMSNVTTTYWKVTNGTISWGK